MRKKIFIIHGKGVVDGIGVEGGGDLDTVGSNAFYSAWFNWYFKDQTQKDPVYNKDYAFGFVNYSEGLSHLVAYKGCDIYIPDFPIDAMAPRLCFSALPNRITGELKNRLADIAANARLRVTPIAADLDDQIKPIFNEIVKKLPGLRKKNDILTLKAACLISETVLDLMLKPDHDPLDTISLLIGESFNKLKQELKYLNTIINDFVSQELNFTGERLKQSELFLKSLRRSLFMVEKAENIHAIILEALSIPGVLYELSDFCDDPFKKQKSLELAKKFQADFSKALTRVPFKAIDQIIALVDPQSAPENSINSNKISGTFLVHLTEDSSGKPVHDIPVEFTLLDENNRIVTVNTDKEGVAELKTDSKAVATYDDINLITWPPGTPVPDKPKGIDSTEESDKTQSEEQEFSTELNGPQAPEDEAEDSPVTDKVTAVAVKLIERDIRFLTSNDVNLIRLDDHHPWTPEIHKLLQNLKNEGLIGSVQIHAFERGREMEKDQAKCGADLIYEGLVKGTPADNKGLEELKRLAHVQDLHIEESKLAIDLSKLIGSGFPKVEMANRLGKIKDYEEMENVMAVTGWENQVKAYEDGLELVLPRLFRTMAHVTIRETDENNVGHDFKILMILAPFTDRKAGEAKINVASAINFLKEKVQIDYLFYCYGSMMMTTRKVTDQEAPVDLSLMSQHVGTKADGGHAEAATCKPGSNPGFPGHLFEKLDDSNFLEYAGYIGGLVSEKFKLDIVSIKNVKCPFYEEQMMPLLDLVTPATWLADFYLDSGQKIVTAFVPAPRATAKSGLTQPTTGAAVGRLLSDLEELDKKDQMPDYVFYCKGGNKISIRKTSDNINSLDLSALAQIFKNPPEVAKAFSACIMPGVDPDFDSKRYRFTNSDNFADYLGQLLSAVSTAFKGHFKSLQPADLKLFFSQFPEAADFVEKAAKKAALIRLIKKNPAGYRDGICGFAKLLKPFGYILPGDVGRDYFRWLYSFNEDNCSNVIVISPPRAGGFNHLKECPVPMLAWGLKGEFEYDYIFTTSKNSAFCMTALNEKKHVNIKNIATLIDQGTLDIKSDQKDNNKSAQVPTAGTMPFKSPILPKEFKRVDDDNYGQYLDWICRCIEEAGDVEVISISRARVS